MSATIELNPDLTLIFLVFHIHGSYTESVMGPIAKTSRIQAKVARFNSPLHEKTHQSLAPLEVMFEPGGNDR